MHHKAHIGLIYTKSESNSGHHDFDPAFHPVTLDTLPLSIEHACMVVVTAERIVSAKYESCLFAFFARGAVNNPGLRGVILSNIKRQIMVKVAAWFLSYSHIDIWPI